MKKEIYIISSLSNTEYLRECVSFFTKELLFKKIIFVSENILEIKKISEICKSEKVEFQIFTKERLKEENVIIVDNSDFKKLYLYLKSKFYEDKIIKLFSQSCFLITESDRYRYKKDITCYFTFSPFQDTQKYFLNFDTGKSIKKQLCIRYINKLDLTNPRNMNVHYCYSFQNYEYINQTNTIIDVVNTLVSKFELKKELVEIHIPDSCLYLKPISRYYAVVTRSDMECEVNLDLPGIHRYVYVCYKYHGQRLFFVNFALVNICGECSKLDSIIYQERLGVLSEKVRYIMQQKKYATLIKLMSENIEMKQRALHELGNHLITIFTLYDLGIKSSNKGVGNELRRKIKSLLILQKYYYPESTVIKNIYLIGNEIKMIFGLSQINKISIDYFLEEYNKVYEELVRNLKRYNRHKEKYTINQAITSLGIPQEEFGIFRENTFNDYSFDS